MIKSTNRFAAFSGFLFLTINLVSYSQPAAAQEENSVALEEVVVTAQKREQSLAEIPMSITVLGGDLLERQQVFNFEDMTALIPGFSIAMFEWCG